MYSDVVTHVKEINSEKHLEFCQICLKSVNSLGTGGTEVKRASL